MSEPDLAGLKSFIELGAGVEPPVFVGRGAAIRDMEYFPGEKWTRPVVIAIDEFQNLPGDKFSPAAEMLFNLHECRYQAPLTVVVGGLGDTLVSAASRACWTRQNIQWVTSMRMRPTN